MINRVTDILPINVGGTGQVQKPANETSFAKMLGQALDNVGQLEVDAAKASYQVAAGQGSDLHSAMIASEKATLAVQLTVQVRNKAVEAYQEIMRMQM